MKLKDFLDFELESTRKHWENMYAIANRDGLARAYDLDKHQTVFRVASHSPINVANILAAGTVTGILTFMYSLPYYSQ